MDEAPQFATIASQVDGERVEEGRADQVFHGLWADGPSGMAHPPPPIRRLLLCFCLGTSTSTGTGSRHHSLQRARRLQLIVALLPTTPNHRLAGYHDRRLGNGAVETGEAGALGGSGLGVRQKGHQVIGVVCRERLHDGCLDAIWSVVM